ncbi:phage antirepressor KilAC domain-containing protein [Lactococcus fujiensis]|uniref:phage antirepressor KilAC domain-containing protein n=1 Tax=Lactococcus fujiensis TaxID=610251 RepID=UPI000AD22D1F|nr:phage antirepressor KilAC domain-containing protein [Lactococcus fujiensis]
MIFESTDDVLVTQIAQDYGIGSPTFNKLLANLRIQRKVNNQWILYSKYQAKGYIKSRTHSFVDSKGNTRTNITTTWTQRGREFLYRKLKKAGYLPEIEKLSVF